MVLFREILTWQRSFTTTEQLSTSPIGALMSCVCVSLLMPGFCKGEKSTQR